MKKKYSILQTEEEKKKRWDLYHKNHRINGIGADNSGVLVDYKKMTKEIEENDTAGDVLELIKKLGYVEE